MALGPQIDIAFRVIAEPILPGLRAAGWRSGLALCGAYSTHYLAPGAGVLG
jgi:hypothetical protein